MDRKNFPITVEQLRDMCDQAIKEGLGNRYVLLSDDEEGNGFHECYYAFSKGEEFANSYVETPYDLDLKKCVTLG